MSQKALDAIVHDKFKIGADAGFAVVTLGSSVEGATTGAVGPDIISWASSSGAYGGISLNGSIIAPSDEDDNAYYRRSVGTQQIIYHTGADQDPSGTALRQSLGSVR
jgi:lipid-binding SYLF domain-containing protein